MHDARKILCMNFIGPMSQIFHYDYFGVNFCMHAQKIIWLRFYIYFDQIWNAGFSHHFGRKYAKSQAKWAKTPTFRNVPVIKYTLPTFYTLPSQWERYFANVWQTVNSLTPCCHCGREANATMPMQTMISSIRSQNLHFVMGCRRSER